VTKGQTVIALYKNVLICSENRTKLSNVLDAKIKFLNVKTGAWCSLLAAVFKLDQQDSALLANTLSVWCTVSKHT